MFLEALNGKVVHQIFQVDFNERRPPQLPWIFFITFLDFDKFLEIEGWFDGEHIKVKLHHIQALEQKKASHHFPDEEDLWRAYKIKEDETLGKLLNQSIVCVEYSKIFNEDDLFHFVRFNTKNTSLVIFEGHINGLAVSNNLTNEDIEQYFHVSLI